MNQHAVGRLPLAGMAGHGITVVEMRMLGRVEFDRAATVHLQPQPPVFVDALDGPRTLGSNSNVPVGRYSELNVVAH